MLIRLFKQMRQYHSDIAQVFNRLDRIEMKQLKADRKFETLFGKLKSRGRRKLSSSFPALRKLPSGKGFCDVVYILEPESRVNSSALVADLKCVIRVPSAPSER